MQPGRRIAFDYGDVRIGVAVSDRDSILASPLVTLQNNEPKLFIKIAEIIAEYEPVHLYVGEPFNLAGDLSKSTTKARVFAERLKLEFGLPVAMIDERLSTISAAQSLRQSGINAKDGRQLIDMAAAVAILEHAISIEKRKDV